MGTVYLAEHPDIGRKVAIKVISNTDSEELVRRFLEEAKAVNRIGHPNIIDNRTWSAEWWPNPGGADEWATVYL
ncbi:MAG: hypothetical protein KAI47_03415 [Deltaproteobacteria bacterium]|nr:hypothetical protein [Deltaproteobacteria bacterium]